MEWLTAEEDEKGGGATFGKNARPLKKFQRIVLQGARACSLAGAKKRGLIRSGANRQRNKKGGFIDPDEARPTRE